MKSDFLISETKLAFGAHLHSLDKNWKSLDYDESKDLGVSELWESWEKVLFGAIFTIILRLQVSICESKLVEEGRW